MKTSTSRTKPHIIPTTTHLAAAAEATHERNRSQGVANFGTRVEGLSHLLTVDQIQMLVRYLFDGVPCRVVADEWRIPRRTAAYRIRQAIRRLKEAGFPVTAPGRGRPKQKQKASYKRPYAIVDSAALDRLTTTGKQGSVVMGKWINSKETAEHED